MVDPDNLSAAQVQQNLENKAFSLMKNDKASHEVWATDFSVIAVKDSDDETNSKILDGWAACNHCMAVYRTHSKKDKDGLRKNYGLSSLHAHVKECKKRVVAKKATSFVKQIQTRIPTFAFNKNKLNARLAEKLKDAELKFIVAGAHSFQSLENDGFVELVQTAIDIGDQGGKVSARDILYGRKSIRQEAMQKFNSFIQAVRLQLDIPIKTHCVTATCDMWADDFIKRSYLDFTVFWVSNEFDLNHSLLRCKHFSETNKTAVNIWREIKEIFASFDLSFGDTPIVTDQGANMGAAYKITNQARYPCMAHRCSTMLDTAWSRTEEKNRRCSIFNNAVRELQKYVQQSDGIQEHLPKTLKSTSGTRPWRSYYHVNDSLSTSYEEVTTCLRQRHEHHRMYQIDPILLREIADLMSKFSLIFDNLEFSNRPTLQNVVPSYYQMVTYVDENVNSSSDVSSGGKIINDLKMEIRKSLDKKFLPSITQLHWVSTFLEPTFKSLGFIDNPQFLEATKKEIRKGFHMLAEDVVKMPDADDSVSIEPSSLPMSPPKRRREDPFATLRGKKTQIISPCRSTKRECLAELDRQIQLYKCMSISADYDDKPVSFWRDQKDSLSIMAQIAKSVFVIPASSAESERHFSTAGQIVTEQRCSLEPDCVEALVVLKEAFLNKMWPSSSKTSPSGEHE